MTVSFMMAWLDDQLETCCPLLVSQLMLSHKVEGLNCLWRSKMIKMLSINNIINYVPVTLLMT